MIHNENNQYQYLSGEGSQGQDYYRGGMAIDFSKNQLSIKSIEVLGLLIRKFTGLRSINISNLTRCKFTNQSKNTKQKQVFNEIEKRLVMFAESISLNKALTHIDLSGIEFNAKVIVELMKALQENVII